jgi:hypothetical protein
MMFPSMKFPRRNPHPRSYFSRRKRPSWLKEGRTYDSMPKGRNHLMRSPSLPVQQDKKEEDRKDSHVGL